MDSNFNNESILYHYLGISRAKLGTLQLNEESYLFLCDLVKAHKQEIETAYKLIAKLENEIKELNKE